MALRTNLAQASTGRELAALTDGRWAPRWYWRDDLEAMQAASRRMSYPDEHPAAVLRAYRPTETWIDPPPSQTSAAAGGTTSSQRLPSRAPQRPTGQEHPP